jgi:hypothetical protein
MTLAWRSGACTDQPEKLMYADVKDRPASRPRDRLRSQDSEDLAATSSEALKGMRVASRPPPRLGRRCRDRNPWLPCSTVLRTSVRLAYRSWGLGKRTTRPTFGRSPRRWSGARNSSASTWSPSPGRPPISNRTCGLTGPRFGASCSLSASSVPRPIGGSGAATSLVAGSEPPTPERTSGVSPSVLPLVQGSAPPAQADEEDCRPDVSVAPYARRTPCRLE